MKKKAYQLRKLMSRLSHRSNKNNLILSWSKNNLRGNKTGDSRYSMIPLGEVIEIFLAATVSLAHL